MTHTMAYQSMGRQEGDSLYAAEDAQNILQIAIAKDVESGELSRTQLVEIAEELGISPETLAAAELEWQVRKYEIADKHQFEQHRRSQLNQSLVRFTLVGGFLVGLNVLWLSWLTPLLYIGLGPWGLKLSWRLWNVYNPSEQRYTAEFERWRRKKQIKQAANRFVSWVLGDRS